ncbi:MAG: hypothetical protein ABI920_08685 [Casimicrobiaceae bacterium]
MSATDDFGKVAVLMGGRAGLGGAQHGCGQAKQAAPMARAQGMAR